MINKNKLQGFTLIELMIVVAILGILSSIAVPSYTSYVQKAKRTEAKTEMLRLAQLQEGHYIQNLSYAAELNKGLGFSSAWLASESGLYNIRSQGTPVGCDSTSASPCTGYRVVAIPVNGKGQENDDKCTKFYLDNTGLKGAFSTTSSSLTDSATRKECWG